MKKLKYLKTFESYDSNSVNFLYASDIIDNYDSIDDYKNEIGMNDITDDEAIAEFELENQFHYDEMLKKISEFEKQSTQFIGRCDGETIGPDSLSKIVLELINNSERVIVEYTNDEFIVSQKDLDKVYKIKSYNATT